MSGRLTDKSVAILVANSGVEQVELVEPRKALEAEGADVTLVAPKAGEVQAFDNDVEKADTFDADASVTDVRADQFDALVLPGGTTNPDALRLDADAVALVAAFAAAGKPIAAICHGPWMLVEADVVRDKNIASWPSLRTDITNAGGTWHDEEAVTCTSAGYPLVTSRNPDDLPAFCKAFVEAFA